MSRGQTPLYWMANHTLSPSTLHTACPSSLSLSFSFSFFPSLLRSGSEMEEEEEEEEEEGGEGGAGQRERDERAKLLDHLGRHVARCLLSQFANRGAHRSSPPGRIGSFTFYDFSKWN